MSNFVRKGKKTTKVCFICIETVIFLQRVEKNTIMDRDKERQK